MNTVKCVVAKSCTYIPDKNNVGKFISLEINMNILINPLLLFKPDDAANSLLETVGLRMSPLKIHFCFNFIIYLFASINYNINKKMFKKTVILFTLFFFECISKDNIESK